VRLQLLRPSDRNHTPNPGEQLLKPIRQLIEPVNDTREGNSTSKHDRRFRALRVSDHRQRVNTVVWTTAEARRTRSRALNTRRG